MSNNDKEKKESYAIDDDDIDIRLIQRQITNVSTQLSSSKSAKKKKDTQEDTQNENSNEGNSVPETKNSEGNGATTIIPPLLKGSTPRAQSQISSKNDSLDVNEFMDMSNNEVSLDLLEQLTNKITAEMGTQEENTTKEETEVESEIETEINEIEQVDESEENINRLEANEELAEEETINQENEKTIVTEQICEYPVNNFDTEYMQTLDYLEGDKRYKKYVIYIDEENLDYMNSLSIQERKDIINSILREQDDIRIAKREDARRKKLITHVLIGVISFVVCVPLLYFLVNKCMEATISNYKRSQYNFEVLYKERGKIQSTQQRN